MSALELLEDACTRLPHTTRAMFGGHGLFAPNGGMFAGIVDDDRIVLKLAQDPERAELIGLGGAPWVYNGKMTMKDWIVVPERFYDEPETLADWARRAHRIAPGKVAKKTALRAPPPAKAAPKKASAKATTKKASAKPTAKKAKSKPAAKTAAKAPVESAKKRGAKRAR